MLYKFSIDEKWQDECELLEDEIISLFFCISSAAFTCWD
jgi:hypothetical protein